MAQLQFAPKAALPIFGGTRGPEITKSITDIQVQAQHWPDDLPCEPQLLAWHACSEHLKKGGLAVLFHFLSP